MYTLGINLSHHSSIALLRNNEVLLFLHEERVNRKKYYQGIPYKALDLIKNYTKVVDYVSYISGSKANYDASLQYLEQQGVKVLAGNVNNEKHHLAHAAAGFYMSGFDTASVFVVDGAGAMSNFNGTLRSSETTSIYDAAHPNIQCVDKTFVVGLYEKTKPTITQQDIDAFRSKYANIKNVTVTTDHDIGWSYATVTANIGFGVFGEGKTMGLSAYGGRQGATKEEQSAYAIQRQLEKYFLSMMSKASSNNVVLSGGCALNILGNSLIKSYYPAINIFVDPIAADGTIALGAAAYYYFSNTRDTNKLMFGPYQGPHYNIDKNYIYECTRKYSIQ